MATTARGLEVDDAAISWVATRAGGPGGQHANTSDTAVTVTIDVMSAGLSDELRQRVHDRVGGVITASSSQSRSQFRNRQLATAVALERLDVAAAPPPPRRRPTRPSRSAVLRRLDEKRQTGERKAARRRPPPDE